MQITIRNAANADVGVIVQFIQELAGENLETSSISAAYAAEYLVFPGCGILLAEIQQQAVGLLSYSMHPNLYHAGDTALIEELVVTEAYRGQGVGSALMKAAQQRFEDTGCAEVSVSTLIDNQPAIAFYKKHGMLDEALLLEKHL